MKNMRRIISVITILFCLTDTATAQIIIKVRPVAPRVVRVAAPSPGHIWIDEDWAYRDNQYVYSGGRWAAPPAGYVRWVPGHWKDSPRRGWVWKPGHWI